MRSTFHCQRSRQAADLASGLPDFLWMDRQWQPLSPCDRWLCFASITHARRAMHGLSLLGLLGIGLGACRSADMRLPPSRGCSPGPRCSCMAVVWRFGSVRCCRLSARARRCSRPRAGAIFARDSLSAGGTCRYRRSRSRWCSSIVSMPCGRQTMASRCPASSRRSLALLALAVANRYALVPPFRSRWGAAARPLVILIRHRARDAVAILGLVALWRFTPPPRALALAGPQVSIHFHGERAMAQIEFASVRARGAHVSLQCSMASSARSRLRKSRSPFQIPRRVSSRYAARQSARATCYRRVDDLAIPIAGRWRLQRRNFDRRLREGRAGGRRRSAAFAVKS